MSAQNPTSRKLVLSRETVRSLVSRPDARDPEYTWWPCSERCLHLTWEASACNR